MGTSPNIAVLLLKSGIAAGELTRDNPTAVDKALTFTIGKIPALRMLPGGRERIKGLLLLALDRLPRKADEQPTLSSEADVGARLAEIRGRVLALHGGAAATTRSHFGYQAATDVESGRLIRELEAVEGNDVIKVPQRVESALLKAHVYGCWQKPQGVKGNQQQAIECYEAALHMSSALPDLEAEVLYRYAMFSLQAPKDVGGGKEKAVEDLSRATEIATLGTELHRKCSEELARHTKKRWSFFN
jgi:hypothetical protein